MSTFIFDNKKVFYDIKGEGKPIILLNGIMMSTGSYNTFVNSLSKSNMLIRVDFFDQGNSERLEGVFYTQDLQVDLLHALIRHLNLKNVVIAGVSYGGEVALKHAIKYPSDVSRLILANTAAWTSNWLKDIGHSWNKVGATLDGDAYYDLAIPVIYSSNFYQEKSEWMKKRREVLVPLFSNKEFQDRMKRLVDSAESHDCRKDIHKILCPTLVISSIYDCLTPLHEQEFIAKEIKHSHHIILPNQGHASMYEDPLIFASLVLGFANVEDTEYII